MFYLRNLFIAGLIVFSFRPSYAQDEPSIRDVVRNLASDLSTELARSNLKAFVAEFHTARTLVIVREYQKTLAFRDDFFLLYSMFTTRLNEGNLEEIKVDDATVREMESAYNRNIDVFRKFMKQTLESSIYPTFLQLNEEQILKNQIQYAVILYDADPKLWSRGFSWSYFIPYSTGL